MKLQSEYKNFTPALMFYIEDKFPTLGANDSKSICYFISLMSSKKGFDYYELLRDNKLGVVYFRIYTMNGLKLIVETNSDMYFDDMDINEWQNIIYETTMTHFMKEEYTALKNGYVKTSGNGCMLLFALLILVNIFFIYNFI